MEEPTPSTTKDDDNDGTLVLEIATEDSLNKEEKNNACIDLLCLLISY